MTIKFNKSEKFVNAKKAFVASLTNSELSEEKREEIVSDYVQALSDDVVTTIQNDVNTQIADNAVLVSRGQSTLTSEEVRYFNQVAQDGLFKEEKVLPVTFIDKVFENLVKEHPLLNAIGVTNMGAVTEIITVDPSGAAVWGDLFGDIKGQVNAAFSKKRFDILKLTAFGAIPKDMLDLGPKYIADYMEKLLGEVMATGLETGFLNGGGSTQHQPIGLTKDVADNGGVSDKTSSGTLTFEPGATVVNEIKEVKKALSKNAKGVSRKVDGKVTLVLNPSDVASVSATSTVLTANGTYVTVIPGNIEIVESEVMTEGKALFFVKGQYVAGAGGKASLQAYDAALAMEDARLYIIKQYANGLPLDNKAALVYDLNIATPKTTGRKNTSS